MFIHNHHAAVCGAVPVDSGALTVEEILLLKQNGVSEQTIQMMLHSELLGHSLAPLPGKKKWASEPLPDPDGGSAIVYTTGSGGQNARNAEEHLKEERAWEMLRHIIVDTRSSQDSEVTGVKR
jgi:hypothetical protein